jgi:hypothetical protein
MLLFFHVWSMLDEKISFYHILIFVKYLMQVYIYIIVKYPTDICAEFQSGNYQGSNAVHAAI